MNIAFFGSSLLSAYWNGAATYYRGIIRALHGIGHSVTFYEPDAYNRQEHCDIEPPEWAEVVVYSAQGTDGVYRALEQASDSHWLIKASGVGVHDELLEREILNSGNTSSLHAFWDVDAPATLDRMDANPDDPFRNCMPRYDYVFTYGGGDPVCSAYRARGARNVMPVYNALDPSTHYPVPAQARFAADLSFLGNRLPDREARVDEFFFKPAAQASDRTFLLGGSGWSDKSMPDNVQYAGHVYTADHNAFNCTPRAVLNISRESMARYGYSPATRVFEAAGAGACLITDYWEGISDFFEPRKEILVAHSGDEVAQVLSSLTRERAAQIGAAALVRVLAGHTYRQRAIALDAVFRGHPVPAIIA